jgi:FixJ family two-component response regulator
MTIAIGLITRDAGAQNRIGSVVSRCGLSIWTADSPDAYYRDARRTHTLCVIIDLPGQEGLEVLEALRDLGIRSPAILIGDPGRTLPAARLANACTLDVLPRPVNTSDLLGWIECVCTATMVLERRRAA